MSDPAQTLHLVFHIEAPLASWGDIAVGEVRPSSDRPSRSGLLGLIAACLGIQRGAERALRALDDLRIAIRLEEAGLPLHDYHTIQVPRTKKGIRFFTRRDELTREARDELQTILSSRAYRMEIRGDVVLSRPTDAARDCPPLETIAGAFRRPAFAPYLGRRSCPLSLPMAPCVVDAPDFETAFRRAAEERPQRVGRIGPGPEKVRWFWEDGCHAPFGPHRSHRRHDHCTSHVHRLFAERIEYEALRPANA